MALYRQELLPKSASDSQIYTFDFSNELGPLVTISNASVTCSVYSGTDATPSSMILGAATIVGQTVQQFVQNGITGVIYQLKCGIRSSDFQILTKSGYLAVVPDL